MMKKLALVACAFVTGAAMLTCTGCGEKKATPPAGGGGTPPATTPEGGTPAPSTPSSDHGK